MAPAVLAGLGAAVSETGSRPLAVVMVLAALSLVPFIALMLTSFVKVSVVMAILRSALGAGQVPPGQVISGLALLLTVFIMAPTAEAVMNAVEPVWRQGSQAELTTPAGLSVISDAVAAGKPPVRAFLAKFAQGRDRDTFFALAKRLRSGDPQGTVHADDVLVLAPAFVVSELRRAFEMGFLIFIPFLVLDLVIANLLAALGLQTLSPTVIALPLKILLFVLADGWNLILRGLVSSYV
ncbi:MAG: EscR/YscR/HrcR family type III secretion system export apparatus protein [Deltaproteobacteria bacterium]|nr:EscR/YscR/HrcR family type III secretion system export apparatus protein [Deltaproteobacteria bacterium]